jgi:hypothetical protein
MMYRHIASGVFLVGLCMKPCAGQAAEQDFPAIADTDATTAISPLKDSSAQAGAKESIKWQGELSLKLHYAPLKQLKQYPFTRTEPGVTTRRTSLWVRSDIPVALDTHIHVSGQASHEDVAGAAQPANQAQVNEAYVELKPTRSMRLKLGRQLSPLGVSDFFQLADVINPRDEEVLGLTDLRDARLPVVASKLSYDFERLGIEAIVQHEFRAKHFAVAQGDFDPFIPLGGASQIQSTTLPHLTHSPNFIMRAYGSQAAGDWFIQVGQVHSTTPMPIDLIHGKLRTGYQRTAHWSFGGNYVVGDWVLKSELAHSVRTRQLRSDIAAQIAQGVEPVISGTAPLSQWMVGASYVGFSGLEVNAELLTEKIHGGANFWAEPTLRHVGIVNIQGSAYKDKLKLGLLLAKWWRGSSLVRTEASYDVNDKLRIKTSLIDYQGGADNAPLSAYRNNRRAALVVSYAL